MSFLPELRILPFVNSENQLIHEKTQKNNISRKRKTKA